MQNQLILSVLVTGALLASGCRHNGAQSDIKDEDRVDSSADWSPIEIHAACRTLAVSHINKPYEINIQRMLSDGRNSPLLATVTSGRWAYYGEAITKIPGPQVAGHGSVGFAGRGFKLDLIQPVTPYASEITGQITLHTEKLILESEEVVCDGIPSYFFGNDAKITRTLLANAFADTDGEPAILLVECTKQAQSSYQCELNTGDDIRYLKGDQAKQLFDTIDAYGMPSADGTTVSMTEVLCGPIAGGDYVCSYRLEPARNSSTGAIIPDGSR